MDATRILRLLGGFVIAGGAPQEDALAHRVDRLTRHFRRGFHFTLDEHGRNIALTDAAIQNFDTNCKMNPPLREASDIEALIAGLRDDVGEAAVELGRSYEILLLDPRRRRRHRPTVELPEVPGRRSAPSEREVEPDAGPCVITSTTFETVTATSCQRESARRAPR